MALSLTIRRIIAVQPVDLPVFHPIAVRLQQMLDSLDFTVDEVARIANDDQALASRILKVANSAFFMGRMRVETIKDAVIRLGAQVVGNLAMAASQAGIHSSDNEFINRYMQQLWAHSHACAVGCRFLAQEVGHAELADQAYLAGLIHDVGKLYLLKALERLNTAGIAQAALEDELLREIFDEMHVEQGSRLMEHWNMPQVYRDAVAFHHVESYDTENHVLTILRLVNIACRHKGISLKPDPGIELLGLQEAQLLGLNQFQCAELEGVIEDSQQLSFEG